MSKENPLSVGDEDEEGGVVPLSDEEGDRQASELFNIPIETFKEARKVAEREGP